jgi:hypothetical protein
MQGGIGKVKHPGAASVFGAVVFMLAAAVEAMACSCQPRTPEQIIEAATVVVDGKVAGVVRERGRITATIKVARIVKGRVGRELVIKTQDNSAACGIALTPGQIVRIAADKLNDGLWTNLCMALAAPKPRQ